ncbi:MAG: hypothetical protein E6R04_07980 [Spirochaetes bacterium]|nr:MAG: hypothetical protein E6R04_07980 [Spirochaetota bacterium]
MQTVETLSSLTVGEWVYLRSTLHAIDNPRFQCAECPKGSRLAKACESINPNVVHKIGGELGYHTCIGNFFSQTALNWLELHNKYEQGVLPYPGSLLDQPNKMIEIFRVIAAHKHQVAEDRIRKQSLKQGGVSGR